MTTATPTTATAYYAKTTITQNGKEFISSHDFVCDVAGSPTEEETIQHLTEGLVEGLFENGDELINLNGLSPLLFASVLVLNEKGNGNEWEIYTNFQEADQDNWENPLQ
jgi:hypothetical protein